MTVAGGIIIKAASKRIGLEAGRYRNGYSALWPRPTYHCCRDAVQAALKAQINPTAMTRAADILGGSISTELGSLRHVRSSPIATE
jgi:hypothetical protein